MGQYPHPGYSATTTASCVTERRTAEIGTPTSRTWRLVEKATAARDVTPGQSWAFTDHRSMAAVIADKEA
jgi:hypothetical protein